MSNAHGHLPVRDLYRYAESDQEQTYKGISSITPTLCTNK